MIVRLCKKGFRLHSNTGALSKKEFLDDTCDEDCDNMGAVSATAAGSVVAGIA